MILLDASVLLAYLRREPGHEAIKPDAKRQFIISAVNYAEVLLKIKKYALSLEVCEKLMSMSRVTIIPFTNYEATFVTQLPNGTVRPLSLGDRACLATALVYGYEILTADKAWSKLGLDLKIGLIR